VQRKGSITALCYDPETGGEMRNVFYLNEIAPPPDRFGFDQGGQELE